MNTAACYANPVNALLNEFFSSAYYEAEKTGTFRPAVDIVETESDYRLYADIAGLTKEDLSITVEKGILTVSGEKSCVDAEENQYRYYERSSGSFQRRFNLPDEVDKDQITAEMKNGELIIKIKKLEKELSRKIDIKVE